MTLITAADWLDEFDWDDLRYLEGFSGRWFDEVKGELNVQSEGYVGLTKEKFNSNKIRKDALAYWLEEASDIMQRQMHVITTFVCFINYISMCLIDFSSICISFSMHEIGLVRLGAWGVNSG